MLDLITMLLLGALAAGAAAVLYVAYLTIGAVRDHLRAKRTEASIREEAVIMKRRMESGKFRIVAGFFAGGDLKEPQIWEAENVDPDLEQLSDDEVIIVH